VKDSLFPIAFFLGMILCGVIPRNIASIIGRFGLVCGFIGLLCGNVGLFFLLRTVASDFHNSVSRI